MVRLFNEPAVVENEELGFEEGEPAAEFDDLGLLRVYDDPHFLIELVETVPVSDNGFFPVRNKARIVHITPVLLDAPAVFDAMVYHVRISNGGDLTVLWADVQPALPGRRHEPFAQSIEPWIVNVSVVNIE